MNKNIFRLLAAITLVSFAGQVILLPSLPDLVPIHWDLYGKIDGWGNKYSLLIFGILPFILLIGMWALPKIDPRKQNYYKHQRTYSIMTISIVLVFILLNWVTTIAALGAKIPVVNIIELLIGLMLIIIGNYMPRLRSNFFIGFKTPWAIENSLVWRKTNRAGGILFYLCGILMMLCAFIPPGFISLIPIALIITGSISVFIYSYYLFKKHSTTQEDDHAEN